MRVLVLIALLGLLPFSPSSAADGGSRIGSTYPLEMASSYPGALFHWIDCLAGTSIAKTVTAHRLEYHRRFGSFRAVDRAKLSAFAMARRAHASSGRDPASLLGIFCTSGTIDEALAAARTELDPRGLEAVRSAIEHFRARYDEIWDDGDQTDAFLRLAGSDPTWTQIETFLASMAKFYGVDPASAPPARIALVPVPDGHGTHAQAMGRALMVEIRPGDTLAEQASVIVHENAHFLFDMVPPERRRALEDYAAGYGRAGTTTWTLLREGLPTALGQGVADKTFRPRAWSLRNVWYHITEVDQAAKRLYPLVNHVLANGARLDEGFVQAAIARMGFKDDVRRPSLRLP